MSDRERKAICCTCGSIRTCKRSRNHREENYWLSRPVDLDWVREVGDLKCVECDRVTAHALLHAEGDWAANHAEMMHRVATGNTHGHFNSQQLKEVARKYREGMPRNPKLHHFRYDCDAQEAWDAGRRTVIALCGEPMTLHRDPSGPSSRKPVDHDDDRQIKPSKVRDQEYEDPETGLWWQVMDCVDCLRVWHLYLLSQRRKVLTTKVTDLLAALLEDKGGYPKRFDLPAVELLLSTIEDVLSPATAKGSADAP